MPTSPHITCPFCSTATITIYRDQTQKDSQNTVASCGRGCRKYIYECLTLKTWSRNNETKEEKGGKETYFPFLSAKTWSSESPKGVRLIEARIALCSFTYHLKDLASRPILPVFKLLLTFFRRLFHITSSVFLLDPSLAQFKAALEQATFCQANSSRDSQHEAEI